MQWMRDLFGFPKTAWGLFVTGTSMANLIAVLVARDTALGFDARRLGIAATPKRLTAYASVAAHGSVRQAPIFAAWEATRCGWFRWIGASR